jgi:hypothetical protein
LHCFESSRSAEERDDVPEVAAAALADWWLLFPISKDPEEILLGLFRQIVLAQPPKRVDGLSHLVKIAGTGAAGLEVILKPRTIDS